MKSILDPTFKYEKASTHSTVDAFRERMEKYKYEAMRRSPRMCRVEQLFEMVKNGQTRSN